MRRASAERSATGHGRTPPAGRGAPTDGKSSASTSSAPRQRIAPSRSSSWAPADVCREDRARNGEDVAAEVVGQPRRDERARAPRRLDDDDSRREAGDDAVADREILGTRLGARRVLREEQVLGGQPLLQSGGARAGSPRRDRSRGRRSSRPGPRARPRAPRRRRRARSPRRPPRRRRQLPRQPPGHVAAVPRRVARAHDRHGRQPQPLEPSERIEQKRRIGDLAQGRRILLVEGRQRGACPVRSTAGGPAQGLGIVRAAQDGPGEMRGTRARDSSSSPEASERLRQAAARAQGRPETLRRQLAPPRPGQGGTPRNRRRRSPL